MPKDCLLEMGEWELIKEALDSFLDSLTSPLAQVLSLAVEGGKISYEEVKKVAKDDAEEVLLLGYSWRLLVPERTSKSIEWEDRVLRFEPGEVYELPNVVRYLIKEAEQSGRWDSERAIASVFKQMGEPEWAQMPGLVKKLVERAERNRISAIQVKETCEELGLGERVDPLIAELKGSGVMSPSLASLAEAIQRKAPLYELNPSLFVK